MSLYFIEPKLISKLNLEFDVMTMLCERLLGCCWMIRGRLHQLNASLIIDFELKVEDVLDVSIGTNHDPKLLNF